MKPPRAPAYPVAIEHTVRTIVTSLDTALDLGALADAAGLSTFHFHRMFRGLAGETPLDMHRRLRLERAATQLLETDDPIIQIAFDAGFETHEAFSRLFRTTYGCPPSRFRQSRNPEAAGTYSTFKPLLSSRTGVHFTTPVASIGSLLAPLFILSTDQLMDVDIIELPQQRIATLAHNGPYNRISEAFAKLGDIAGPAGLFGAESAMLAIYYDDPETTPVEELRSDAALTVGSGRQLPSALTEKTLPAGKYARSMHVGSYEGIGDAWIRFLGRWLPQSGHAIGSGVCFERYLNTPMHVPTEQLRTELYIHLA